VIEARVRNIFIGAGAYYLSWWIANPLSFGYGKLIGRVIYRGDHGGRPIFVVSHRPPGPSVANYPLVKYVTDGIVSAMTQAKAAAGDGNVLVQHGAAGARGRCA
jgi:hypothetical protein